MAQEEFYECVEVADPKEMEAQQLSVLRRAIKGSSTKEEAASIMQVSVRTLDRFLKQHGYTYKSLKNEISLF